MYRVPPIITSLCSLGIRLQPRHTIGGVNSQMNVHAWDYYLSFEDSDLASAYLSRGIHYGFDIVDSLDSIESYLCSNYKSVLYGEAFDCVDKIRTSELSNGKFVISETKPWCVHALGAVPKQDGSYRPITDCKQPLGLSINNYREDTHQPFCYTTVDKVSESMTQGCFMASVDIASAYRSITVNPDHWTCQGQCWNFNGQSVYLKDTCLCFGLKCAPYIFTNISDFVVRTMYRLGYSNVANYIDDFLVFGQTYEECLNAQLALVGVLGDLGFCVSWKKCASPSQSVRYLGIDFDSSDMTIRLPQDKLLKLIRELDYFSTKDRATKRQLQWLCGLVAHAAKVVRGGRTRRLIELLRGLKDGNPRIRLTTEFKEDIHWWRQFASTFNGVECVIRKNHGDGAVFFTDSCLTGYGITCGSDWQAGSFVKSNKPINLSPVEGNNINYLELVPILLALNRYKYSWKNLQVLCYSDNTQAVSAINNGYSENKHSMSLLRSIVWVCVTYNIILNATHIPGLDNTIADALSYVSQVENFNNTSSYSICCSESHGAESGFDSGYWSSLGLEYESSS